VKTPDTQAGCLQLLAMTESEIKRLTNLRNHLVDAIHKKAPPPKARGGASPPARAASAGGEEGKDA
jgi:hypothetical protein